MGLEETGMFQSLKKKLAKLLCVIFLILYPFEIPSILSTWLKYIIFEINV